MFSPTSPVLSTRSHPISCWIHWRSAVNVHFLFNYISYEPPGIPGTSLVNVAAWCGNKNQKCGNAEASEKGLYLVYLGSRAFTALKNYLEYWPAICVRVQYKMIVFLVCPFQRSIYYSMALLHVFNWEKNNYNQVGEMCKTTTESVQKYVRSDCYGHVVSICWAIINGWTWTEGDRLQKTNEGWWSQKKLGLIAGCGLTEHLSPPSAFIWAGLQFICWVSSYNNEFPWSADMLLNIH